MASHGLFNVTAGVRLTHRDWNNETFVSPRLSVGYIPEWNDRWTLRAATGLYYQAPFYKELRDTVRSNGSVYCATQSSSAQSAIGAFCGGS